MTALLASSPHHAASSAAEPMPCVPRPATALRSPAISVKPSSASSVEEPRVSLLPQRSRVGAVGRDVGDRLELARPRPERVLGGGSQARPLAAEAVGVVGLRARPLGEEVGRAGRHHDRRDAGGRDRGHGDQRRRRPDAAAQREDQPEHDERDREVHPCAAGVGEQDADQQDRQQHGLGGQPRRQQPGTDDLLDQDQRGRDEERPEDVRVLEEGPAAIALRQQLGAGQRPEQREHPDHGRGDRRGEIGAHEQQRAPA